MQPGVEYTQFGGVDGWRSSINGRAAEYIVAIDVTRVRFPADAITKFQ